MNAPSSVAAVTAGAPGRALECHAVTVTYDDVVALRDVSVGFEPNLIHAVLGQNGAGKTTFARVCAGIVRPSTGQLRIGGRALQLGSVAEARASGVELVHQSFALPPSFTVAEAMEFGSTRRDGALYSRRKLEARWARHLDAVGLSVRPTDRIRDLPVESQQAVEIARALVTDARILILDEPTAVLAPSGIETLFERVRRLKRNGVTVLLILHKIREVLAVADTVTILRDGRLIEGLMPAGSVDAAGLANLIVGSGATGAGTLSASDKAALVGLEAQSEAAPRAAATSPMLQLQGVSTRPDSEGPALRDVGLTVGAGQIVGIAGVEGNGQRTLVRALATLAALNDGRISLEGVDITDQSLAARRAQGLRIIPFERNVEGLSLSSALWENWAARLLLLRPLLTVVSPSRLRRLCKATLERWDVRFASVDQTAGSLSGGNAQKVILAREVDEHARLIIAAQPTRGLDVGATAFVWRALREARRSGAAVLLISSDLDELFDVSDRIAVMVSGRVVAEFSPPYRLEAVGAAMTGVGA